MKEMHDVWQQAMNRLEKLLPKCPKCGAEDSMEHVKTDYHGMETHYDQCVVCQHRTQPE